MNNKAIIKHGGWRRMSSLEVEEPHTGPVRIYSRKILFIIHM
jgi:hypothetical protein